MKLRTVFDYYFRRDFAEVHESHFTDSKTGWLYSNIECRFGQTYALQSCLVFSLSKLLKIDLDNVHFLKIPISKSTPYKRLNSKSEKLDFSDYFTLYYSLIPSCTNFRKLKHVDIEHIINHFDADKYKYLCTLDLDLTFNEILMQSSRVSPIECFELPALEL